MLYGLILILIILFSNIGINHEINAQPTLNDIFEPHSIVFCGTVIAKDNKGFSHIGGPVYTIDIINQYKPMSGVKEKINAIGAEDSNGPRSMVPLDVDQKAIFYADFEKNHYLLSPHTAEVQRCDNNFVPTPLGQYRFGINSSQIYCVSNYMLVTKITDGSPACVSMETKQKLIERGWAKPT